MGSGHIACLRKGPELEEVTLPEFCSWYVFFPMMRFYESGTYNGWPSRNVDEGVELVACHR